MTLRQRIRRFRKRMWSDDFMSSQSFRLGYMTALDDIERTGLKPTTNKTKNECVERALERLVEDPER